MCYISHSDLHLSAIFVTLRPNCDISMQILKKTDYFIPSSPFHIHAILKLAPVLSQLSEKMHVVRIFCSAAAKTSTVTPIFYFIISIRTVLPFNEKKTGRNLCSVF